MLDPSALHRAAILLDALRHPTVTLEDKANGRGREFVARVLLDDGEAVGQPRNLPVTAMRKPKPKLPRRGRHDLGTTRRPKLPRRK